MDLSFIDNFFVQDHTDEEIADVVDKVLSYGFNKKTGTEDGISKCVRSKDGCPVFFDEHLLRCRRMGFYTFSDAYETTLGNSIDFSFKNIGPDVIKDRAINVMKILADRYKDK